MDAYFAAKKLEPSLQNYAHAKLFVTDFGYVGVKMMKLRSELPLALKYAFKSVGVSNKIIYDGTP